MIAPTSAVGVKMIDGQQMLTTSVSMSRQAAFALNVLLNRYFKEVANVKQETADVE